MRVREYKSTPAGGAAEPALVERAEEPGLDSEVRTARRAQNAEAARTAEAAHNVEVAARED